MKFYKNVGFRERQPPGFIDSCFPDHVCLLKKALYGLKQAPRAWFHKLRSSILNLQFVNSQSDPSLFIRHHGNETTLLLVYVDDILFAGSNPTAVHSLISTLNSQFSLKDLGSLRFFLGIE